MAELLAILSALFYALSNFFIKLGNKKLSADHSVLYTLVVDNIFNLCMVFLLVIFYKTVSLTFVGVIFFMLGGICTSFLGRTTLFTAINKIGSARSNVLRLSSPLTTLIIGVFVLGETFALADFIGFFVILSGMVGIALEQGKSNVPIYASDEIAVSLESSLVLNQDKKGGDQRYILIGILSGILFGLGSVFRKAGLATVPSIVEGVVVGSLTSLILLSIKLGYRGSLPSIRELCSVRKNFHYLLAGIFTTLGQYALFGGLFYGYIAKVNAIRSIEPLMALALSRLFLQDVERVTKYTWFYGVVVVLGAVVLILM